MTTFVDTSAFFALFVAEDEHHDRAAHWFRRVAAEGEERLVTHNYVVVESVSLVHRRLGAALTRMFLEDVLPACEVRFVQEPLHTRATSAFLAGLGRRPSFVDRVSFEMMREARIRQAFAFDPDFAREGFETVP
ncbi:MAG: PIN domain-containing protein [Actinobacteria bacterium]|nr:PIN domain-containing protein [Actinomycetota bacterium]